MYDRIAAAILTKPGDDSRTPAVLAEWRPNQRAVDKHSPLHAPGFDVR
jgi:hypothetical protein